MPLKHYAAIGISRSIRQVIHALRNNSADLTDYVSTIAKRLRRDEARIASGLNRTFKDLDVLIIGPGPYLVEPRFFGLKNKVTAIDLDVIPQGFAPGAYFQMLRQNGMGRFLKTAGRKILGIDRRHAQAWRNELGTKILPDPRLIQGDILQGPPQQKSYDVVACWAVFQHISDPALAIKHMKAALRPGGRDLFPRSSLYVEHRPS